jgi:glycosyltransferase involved in cell wall biosynthesis
MTRVPKEAQRLVSVCVPAYQAEGFIGATIESVLTQTYTNWELIVLDNNSLDRTGEIARSYDDPRIQVVTNHETLDLADNWNAVSELATGEYLKLLCADDLLHPDCLAEQVAVLDEHEDVSVVASRRDFIGAHGEVVLRDRGLTGLLGRHAPDAVVKRVISSGINPIGWPAAMLFRRSVFVDVGAFDGRWLYPIDLELAIRMLREGAFYGTARSLASFRISPTSASSTMKKYGTQHREMMRTVAADPRWSIGRFTLLRGLVLSHIETTKKFLLFNAVNSRWSPMRQLPSLFLQPLRKSVSEGSQISTLESQHQMSAVEH